MRVTGRTQALEQCRIMHDHATGALHQRLDDHRRTFSGMPGQKGLKILKISVALGQRHHMLLRQNALEQGVHALFRIADRHGTKSVAMIAAKETHNTPAFWFAAVGPILNGHLQRNLDRNRARLGKKHPFKWIRQHIA